MTKMIHCNVSKEDDILLLAIYYRVERGEWMDVVINHVYHRWRIELFDLLRTEFPEASEDEYRRKFADITLGTELATRVFGSLPDSVARPIDYRPDEDSRYAFPEDFILAMLRWYKHGQGHHWNNAMWLIHEKGNRLELDYLRRWAGELEISDLLERALSEAAT